MPLGYAGREAILVVTGYFPMKRFTDTDKWKESWFRKLTAAQKCLWFYMQDNCDHAGFIELDLELASFQIGLRLKADDFAALRRDFTVVAGGKVWLHGFVRAQYGKISIDCKPHRPVFASLEFHGVTPEKAMERLPKPIESPSEALPIGSETLQDKDKDKDQDKDKDKDKDKSEVTPRVIYDAYPRKIAPQDAIRAIEKCLVNPPLGAPQDYRNHLLSRTLAYAAATKLWPEEDHQYIPHPTTWFNRGSYDDDPETWTRHGDSGVNGKVSSYA